MNWPEWLKTFLSVLLGGAISYFAGVQSQRHSDRSQRFQYAIEQLRAADELELQSVSDVSDLRIAVLNRRSIDQLPPAGFVKHMAATHILSKFAPQTKDLALEFSTRYSSVVSDLRGFSFIDGLADPPKKLVPQL